MKRIFFVLCMTSLLFQTEAQVIEKKEAETSDSFYWLTPADVRAVRAGENTPFTRTNLNKKQIQALNLGADIPFVLQSTPSVVVHSDAGNGIGYTGIRIRGTDATRINITLNGVPFNDAESQGTFFVNLPDFLSSTNSIQIQRGVGTSTNGTGAFGASINFSTHDPQPQKYLELSNSYGSFHSRKHTLKGGTGSIKGFSTDIRLSSIQSDGFIDRAFSDLRSFYLSSAYQQKNTKVRLTIFSGKEQTYQAWYGISEADLGSGNRTINYAGTARPVAPYENETDNYTQTHYQLFAEERLSDKWQLSTTLFLTRGKGYYEQYRANEKYERYGLSAPLVNGNLQTRSDFIRQLWLDNYFFGQQMNLRYQTKKTEWMMGSHLSTYNGDHYGKLIWATYGLPSGNSWYNNKALKKDRALYVKQQTAVAKNWFAFYDIQFRQVGYDVDGFRDNPGLAVNTHFNFLNPKLGITYRKKEWRTYLSYSRGNKEPNRDDFEAGQAQRPLHEQLHDIEAGIERQNSTYQWSITGYYMHYKNQLVLTGKINDVGAYTRSNVAVSYRTGVELQGQLQILSWLQASANLSLSSNQVKDLEEFIDDYDQGIQVRTVYARSTLAFSPACIGNGTVTITPFKNSSLSLNSRYVSRQYLDNTAMVAKSLDPFFVQDLHLRYSHTGKKSREWSINATINNLLDTRYEPNGYTFSYITGGQRTTENYYFPMAGINYMLGLTIRL
ncbi:MAG: TonB-dependent receptor [Sphingomonadales bacterium]|nr:TonB-dependent receptor [Sphingomonadales bacterium]